MSDILIENSEGVTTITLNRLARKNAITASMYADLAQAVIAAGADTACRVLLFQGHETIFSAGNDIEDFLNNPPATEEASVFAFLRAISTCEKPVMAAVCGPAVGIGATLLLHCDLVYAGDNAAFSMPFVNLGLVPEAASSLLVPQLMGYHRAAEVLLMGEPFMAEAALEVGFVNRVVAPTETNAYARTQALKLAKKPLTSLIATKRLLKAPTQAQVQQVMVAESKLFGPMLQGPAAREAFGAFVEKRRPDFSNL
jgi:enoyl-CoA hydratase/carnithine racemase